MTDPGPASVLRAGADTTGGAHCETTALGVLLDHAGLHLSEPMLLGLGGGICFVYWDSVRQPVPFLGGRVKPFELTRQVAERLGLQLEVRETASPRLAWEQVRASLDSGVPVGLQLDCFDLEYFTTRVHFAGHVVAVHGRDERAAYVVDTAQQGGAVSTSLASLARARAARGPMSARHRSFTVAVPEPEAVARSLVPAVVRATTACAGAFLDPPIANLGHRGIRTAARRLASWPDRLEEPARDLPLVAALMERGGTGGSLFRNLYRDFLAEAVALLADHPATEAVTRAHDLVADSARRWTAVAADIERAGTTGDPAHLTSASRELLAVADVEVAAMTLLRDLPA